MTLTLIEVLRKIHPSGPDGFEGLIASLLKSLTGLHFNLAISGSQDGRDMGTRQLDGNVIAIECKRYGKETELNERELLGEIEQAQRKTPDLDLWVLVASRELPSQLEESLVRSATEKGIGFFAISSGDGNPSSLETLCAHSIDVVTAHRGIQSIASANAVRGLLDQIAADTQFLTRVTKLKTQFSSPLIGYDNWRAAQNKWFLTSLKSMREAQAIHGQPVNIREPGVMLIKREAALSSLEQWYQAWKGSKHFLAALGEEGDGKTWSIAAWLSKNIQANSEFPGVIFLSSTALNETGGTDLESLFIDAIQPRFHHVTKEQVQSRLGRWLKRPVSEKPLFVLILDGINERRTSDWWRAILQQLASEKWINHVAVLITCRTSYWERNFKPLRYLPTESFILQPYDDGELTEALAHHNLRREEIHDSVLPLIRKPRYFDLMVRHHERIAESGDVTVARLIYEDWRDRYERKTSLPLTDDDFQTVLRHLAQRCQAASNQLSGQAVADTLPPFSDQGGVLEELRTGGVLQKTSNGEYRVNSRLLEYGLGLLLVDQLEQEVDEQDHRETIARWLEPHAEMDIKASICEFAAFHALTTNTLPLNGIVALLESWVGSQNPTQSTESNLTAYLVINPEAYVALAEVVWREANDNRWVQELITRAFLEWCESPRVSPILYKAFERWLGFVHIYGFRLGRDEDTSKAAQKIASVFGGEVKVGPIECAGYPITVIDDDGLLRLGRVAFAVISHLPRKKFMRALAIGCLAEAIMGYPERYELFAWIMQTSQENLWPEVREEVNKLLVDQTSIARRATYRLLSFEASEEAINLRETIEDEISLQNSLISRHREDPCTSGFAWSEEDCATCLRREDLPVKLVANHIQHYCVNPDLPVPESLKAKVSGLIEGIKTEEMDLGLYQTSADYDLTKVEPMLAAYAPEALAALIRSLARQIVQRREMAQRQLSITLVKHSLILTQAEQQAVRTAWDDLKSNTNSWNKIDEETDLFLFKVLIAQMDGDSQLAALIRRPAMAVDWLSYENSFLPIVEWNLIRSQLASATEKRVVTRTLWFLSVCPLKLPPDLLNTTILPWLNNEDTYTRALVLELVYGAKESNAAKNVIDNGWGWSQANHELENHWGNLILCEYGQHLAFDEILRRVQLSHLGYAIKCRGGKQEEVRIYANLIHQLWLKLGTKTPELPIDLPGFIVESNTSESVQDLSRCRLADNLSSYSVSFIRDDLTWGGVGDGDDSGFQNWDAREEQRRKLQQIVQDTIEQQKAANNIWFGQIFNDVMLDKVIIAAPDYLDQWVSTNNAESRVRFYLGRSFYTALCRVLLKEQVSAGIKLYWQLQDTYSFVRVVDGCTQIDLFDYALFAAVLCEESESAWERKIQQCNTDQELMEIALLAQGGVAKEWLWSYISAKLRSNVSLDKSRAIVLLGFFDDAKAIQKIEDTLKGRSNTWPVELAKIAKKRWNKNNWAKHWFNRFLVANDDVAAWASFRLLLRCVGKGFWFWRKAAELNAKTTHRREVFLKNNLENIQRAIRDNDKETTEQFLGQKVLRRQVWPWM